MNTFELTLQPKTDGGHSVFAALARPSGFLPQRREGTLNLDIPALSEIQFEPLEYGIALRPISRRGKPLSIEIP